MFYNNGTWCLLQKLDLHSDLHLENKSSHFHFTLISTCLVMVFGRCKLQFVISLHNYDLVLSDDILTLFIRFVKSSWKLQLESNKGKHWVFCPDPSMWWDRLWLDKIASSIILICIVFQGANQAWVRLDFCLFMSFSNGNFKRMSLQFYLILFHLRFPFM
jgi:hypothetical protein